MCSSTSVATGRAPAATIAIVNWSWPGKASQSGSQRAVIMCALVRRSRGQRGSPPPACRGSSPSSRWRRLRPGSRTRASVLENTRLASLSHTGHAIDLRRSERPGYLEATMVVAPISVCRHSGLCGIGYPRSVRRHQAHRGHLCHLDAASADGAGSKSKIRRGMYTVAHEFGMSTTPEKRPSIGAEPRIMYAWISV